MGWKHFRRGVACPVCGDDNEWCSETDDAAPGEAGYRVRCMRADSAPGWTKIPSKARQGGTFVPDGAPQSCPADRERIEREKLKARKQSDDARQRARELYAAARPLERGDRASEYLASRGLSVPGELVPSLRFDPACDYRPTPGARDAYDQRAMIAGRQGWPVESDGRPRSRPTPCLVCAATDPETGRVSAVQRIYLHPREGERGKLPMPDAKKMLGRMDHSAVRLMREGAQGVAGEIVILCEGVETGLALWLATGMTVFACVSTAGLRDVRMPSGQRPAKVIIAADRDAWDEQGRCHPGLEAATRCAARMSVVCGDVKIALPPIPQGVRLARRTPAAVKSVDWLDVYSSSDYGPERVRELVLGACVAPDDERIATALAPPDGVPPAKDGASGGGGAKDDGRYVDARRVWVRKSDPIDHAEQFLRTPFPPRKDETFVHPSGAPMIRRFAETWWRYDGQRYRMMKDEKLRSLAQNFLRWTVVAKGKPGEDGEYDYEPFGSSPTRAASLVQHLAGVTMLGGLGEEPETMPLWIRATGEPDRDAPPPANCIAFENGILDVEAWRRGEKRLMPHSPGWFCTARLNYCLPEDAHPTRSELAWERAPIYRRFIGQVFGEDTSRDVDDLHGLDQIDLWHEWIGYCMVPDYSVQAVLGIQGNPGTGKGTLIRVFRKLFGGDDQVASTSMSDLGEKYGLEPLVGKLVAIDPDAESASHTQSREGVSRLKKISGGDAVQVRRMSEKSIPSIQLPARFTIVCNELPWMPDSGGALKRRFRWLHTPRPVPPDEVDGDLDAKLAKELGWIAVHALDGLSRLRNRIERGGPSLVTPEAARHVAEQFTEKTAPLAAFVEECLIRSPEMEATKDEMYQAYQRFCEAEGITKGQLGKPRFGELLAIECPWIESGRMGSTVEGTGKRPRLWRHVRIRDEWLPHGREASTPL